MIKVILNIFAWLLIAWGTCCLLFFALLPLLIRGYHKFVLRKNQYGDKLGEISKQDKYK